LSAVCPPRARGKTVEEAANEAVRLGLSESCWQRLVKRGRNYSRGGKPLEFLELARLGQIELAVPDAILDRPLAF